MEQHRLDEAYAFCEAVCRNASTTFYSSFSALQLDKRRAVHAVYALCRWVDDIVDGDEEPTILETEALREATERRQAVVNELHAGATPSLAPDEHRRRMMALVDIRLKLEEAADQTLSDDDHPIFIALQDVFNRYPIKLADFETVIEGMEDDLYPVR
ncbi:MAG: squalene/phytoene synthase family protein, partial [Candidatus Thermoplasmatota archaeon]|nr:squalene/phytoene synthase family protein [Candidatus Thermoplasmatota archaeon]